MSASPDGRYVRCTASDWGDALLYWWAVMFPSHVCARTKEVVNATKEIGNAILLLFGSVGVTAQEAVEE